MRFYTGSFSTNDCEEEDQFYSDSHFNKLNIYRFSRKELKVRSLDHSCKVAKRILNSVIPELSISQFNESIRIFSAYLSSFKYTLKNDFKIETLILASAYISIIKQGGYASLLYMSSKLKLKNYRFFASLVRRMCARLRIDQLPTPSIMESLQHINDCIERYLREKFSTNGTTEEVLFDIKNESEKLYLDNMSRDSLLQSLVENDKTKQTAYKSTIINKGKIKNLPTTLIMENKSRVTDEALSNAKNLAFDILQIIFEQDRTNRDNILNSNWFSNGLCSTPIICAALSYSYRLHCKELLLKDIIKATGVSKSSVINGRKIISRKLKVISESLFPGWLGPSYRELDSEMPPSIVQSLVNLIRSCNFSSSLN